MSRRTTRSEIIMGVFRIRLEFLLAVAFWSIMSILMRSVDGDVSVGGLFGWKYNGTAFNYQDWASNTKFIVGDILDFGISNPKYPVMLVATPMAFSQSEEGCDSDKGQPVEAYPNTSRVQYLLQIAGNYSFMNPDGTYCSNGMKFTTTVQPGSGSPTSQKFTATAQPGSGSPTSQKFTAQPGSGSPTPQPLIPGIPDTANSGPNTSPTAKQTSTNNSSRVAWIVGGVTVALVLLVLTALVFMKRRGYWERLTKSNDSKGVILSYMSDSRTHSHSPHTKDVESGDIEWPWGPQRFSYKELKGATNSFNSSLVLGEGGFGTVYKGYIGDSPAAPVAVKRLSQHARQGAREFMAELNIISQLRHRNLVQLVGWCDEDEELILVYEYMPNGDLDDLIFGGYLGDERAGFTPLLWKFRYNTFVGVATALVYLHEEWEQRVVHRDIKTSNVMLDSHFNARLGDFGLARLSAHSQTPRTTLIAGTIGYLAPEFNLTGRATDKTDVYAFGVVVLEVSCARRPLTSNCILVDWAWDLHKEDKLLDAIDPKLDVGSVSGEEEMKRALQVGLLCCHPDPGARPTMRHVLNILTGETPLPKMPRSKPVAVFAEDR